MFREVCRFIVEEQLLSRGIEYIEVNLSVVQCMQESLYQDLLNVMDEYHLPYPCINLEITETAAVMSHETLMRNMSKLIERGVNFSLDDYGTGFSNTTFVIKYPFRIVKIDKSMVWSAMEDEKAMYALKYTMAMVKAMGMELVAEGVENEEHIRLLTELGCDFFQGYYFWNLIRNTLVLSLYSLIAGFPIPILVALILNELKPGFKKVTQTVLYAPHFISTVVVIGMITISFLPPWGWSIPC